MERVNLFTLAPLLWLIFSYYLGVFLNTRPRKLPLTYPKLLYLSGLYPILFHISIYLSARIDTLYRYNMQEEILVAECIIFGVSLGVLGWWLTSLDGAYLLLYPYFYLVDLLKGDPEKGMEKWLRAETHPSTHPWKQRSLICLLMIVITSIFLVTFYGRV